MLTADQLDVLPGPILDLYERFHISILEDIARRVANQLYTSAAWQMQRMIEAGLLYDDLLRRIAELTGESERVLRRVFEKAGVTAMGFDDAIYKAAGLKPLPLNLSPQMTRILSIGLRKTAGLLRNLTLTTARSGQDLFVAATDLAYMQVSTGTLDYATAVREAVKEMAGQGLEVIYYESGHRDKIDVAVRRAVLTGVSQTAGELTEARADEMGTDLVQTSAHLGARNKGDVPENHEMWQGQVFTRGKDPANAAYPNFYEVTGYMTITGLYGINCRHSHYPFFKGISENAYKQATLDEYANATVTYNGKEMSYYDATQIQRKFEREIRKARREQAAVEAAGEDSFEEQAKARKLRAGLKDFLKQTGLSRKYERERMGFVPSITKIAGTGKITEYINKPELRVIGRIGEYIEPIIAERTTAKTVMVSDSVLKHIEKHRNQFDIDLAKKMLPQVISNPKFIYQGKKVNSFQFIEDFTERYFLLVPIKYLPNELWLETLLIEEKKRFLRRWEKVLKLYTRK